MTRHTSFKFYNGNDKTAPTPSEVANINPTRRRTTTTTSSLSLPPLQLEQSATKMAQATWKFPISGDLSKQLGFGAWGFFAMTSSRGRYYWAHGGEFKAKGIVAVFAWVSISEAQLNDCIGLYSSLGWNSLVCRSNYLNPYALLAISFYLSFPPLFLSWLP